MLRLFQIYCRISDISAQIYRWHGIHAGFIWIEFNSNLGTKSSFTISEFTVTVLKTLSILAWASSCIFYYWCHNFAVGNLVFLENSFAIEEMKSVIRMLHYFENVQNLMMNEKHNNFQLNWKSLNVKYKFNMCKLLI